MLDSDEDGQPVRLLGHVSRANGHWRTFQKETRAVAIFHGPHTYITPRWYTEHDVPTWNYVVGHIHGSIRLKDDFDWLVGMLNRMSTHFESNSDNPWQFKLPGYLDQPGKLTGAIIGFELDIDKIETKFKLNQNRSEVDRKGVIEGLGRRSDDNSQAILKLMELGLRTGSKK